MKKIMLCLLAFLLMAGLACASQNPIVVPNGTGAQVRGWINDALNSLTTLFSGPGDPATMYPYQLKANTSTGYLQQRNPGNTDWYNVRPLDTRNLPGVYNAGIYMVTYVPAITAIQSGVIYQFTPDTTNTGTAYFQANSCMLRMIVKMTPSGTIDLSAGDLKADYAHFLYLTNDGNNLILLNPANILPNSHFYFSDLKTTGTNGGTFTGGSWQTRTLNNFPGSPPSWLGCGLPPPSNNQFYLTAGTYYLRISVPALMVNNHQALLYNVTDDTAALVGSSAYSPASGGNVTSSLISGKITIAGTKYFEVRHRCATTRATDGFGGAAALGQSEVYTQVEIWRE